MSVLFVLLFLCLFFWLGFHFTALMLKIAYVCCIGIPLAVFLGVLGILLCCTVILIPAGMALMKLAGRALLPF